MSTYEKYFVKFEKGFFASVAMSVMINSAVGAIAAMTVLEHGTSLAQMLQLITVVGAAMCCNGAVLSQQKPRTVYNFFIGSLMVNTLISIINVWLL